MSARASRVYRRYIVQHLSSFDNKFYPNQDSIRCNLKALRFVTGGTPVEINNHDAIYNAALADFSLFFVFLSTATIIAT